MSLETYEDADAFRIYYDLDTEVPKTGGSGDLRGTWSKTIRSVARNFYGFLRLGTAGRIPIGYTDLDGKNFYRSMEVIGDANLQADGTLTVNNGAITGDKIAAGTITAANIAPGAVDGTLLGANSVTSENIATDAVGSDEIATGAVGTTELADNSVTAEKIANEAIETEHIAPGAVDSIAIAAGAVGSSEIADNAVINTKIAAGAIETTHFAAGAVDSAAIGANAVGTSEIADDAVTVDKIGAGAVDTTALAATAVTRAKIAANAVGTSEIENGTVTAAKLAESYIAVAATNAAIAGAFTAGQLKAILSVAANVGLTVKAAASQTGNLFEIQNSAGTILWKVQADGTINFMGANVIVDSLTHGGVRKRVGNSFPTVDLIVGEEYQHELIEKGMVFKWDGADWMSKDLFYMQSTRMGANSTGVADTMAFPLRGQPGIADHYVECMDFNFVVPPGQTNGNSVNYYNIAVWAEDTGDAGSTGAFTVVSGTANTQNSEDSDVPYSKHIVYNKKIITTNDFFSLRIQLQNAGSGQGNINYHAVVAGRYIGANP